MTSIQRVALLDRGDTLFVTIWPADLVDQAKHVYSVEWRVAALLELDAEEGWYVRPNFYVGYFNAPVGARWYTTADARPIAEYLPNWVEDLDESVGRYERKDVEDDSFWQWLLERGYAQLEDRPGLDRLLATRVSRFDVRPSIEVAHGCAWAEAVALDDGGAQLATAVAEAVDRVLRGLDEPPPASLGSD